MYAIIQHSGTQKKVAVGDKLLLDRMQQAAEEEITTDKVLAIKTDSGLVFGEPLLEGASVKFKVLAHVRGQKIRVRHFKRRKHHMKFNGHRQDYTQVEIIAIDHKAKKASKAKQA